MHPRRILTAPALDSEEAAHPGLKEDHSDVALTLRMLVVFETEVI